MKKVVFIVLLFVGLVGILLYINDTSFSPLTKKDFQKLFYEYSGHTKKECEVDFLGTTFRNELFEVYFYKLDADSVRLDHPEYNGIWEQKNITDETVVSKWKSCPLDTVTHNLFEFTLTAENFDERECIKSFNEELNSSKNYYSYVYFNELEQYFLLYCPGIGNLYYVRRKGF